MFLILLWITIFSQVRVVCNSSHAYHNTRSPAWKPDLPPAYDSLFPQGPPEPYTHHNSNQNLTTTITAAVASSVNQSSANPAITSNSLESLVSTHPRAEASSSLPVNTNNVRDPTLEIHPPGYAAANSLSVDAQNNANSTGANPKIYVSRNASKKSRIRIGKETKPSNEVRSLTQTIDINLPSITTNSKMIQIPIVANVCTSLPSYNRLNQIKLH